MRTSADETERSASHEWTTEQALVNFAPVSEFMPVFFFRLTGSRRCCGESPFLGGFRRLVVSSTLAEGPSSAAMLELLFQVLLPGTNWLLVCFTDARLCVSTVEAKVVVFILRVPLLSERWRHRHRDRRLEIVPRSSRSSFFRRTGICHVCLRCHASAACRLSG